MKKILKEVGKVEFTSKFNYMDDYPFYFEKGKFKCSCCRKVTVEQIEGTYYYINETKHEQECELRHQKRLINIGLENAVNREEYKVKPKKQIIEEVMNNSKVYNENTCINYSHHHI